jgi:hypothetical protein
MLAAAHDVLQVADPPCRQQQTEPTLQPLALSQKSGSPGKQAMPSPGWQVKVAGLWVPP